MVSRSRGRLLDAVDEGCRAVLSAVEDTEMRGHKVSRTVLTEARKGEHEAVELARKWIGSPTSVFDNFEAVVDVQARAQRRLLELGRDTLLGAVAYGGEVQRALSRVVTANRQAAEVVVDSARDGYSRLAERVPVRAQERLRLVRILPASRRARTARRRAQPARPKATEIQALAP